VQTVIDITSAFWSLCCEPYATCWQAE